MKQIEITTRINNNLNEIDKLLKKQGFKIIRNSVINDKYLAQNINLLNKNNILDFLSKSVILRFLNANGEEFRNVTYKIKTFKNNETISEQKINLKVENLDTAEKLFNHLEFELLVNVKYNVVVYSNDKIELAFQDVDGLGLLLEYENETDFDGVSNEIILKTKRKMLEEVKSFGLKTTLDVDVKKAYELILKRIGG